MVEEESQTPITSLPDIFATGLAYAPVDNLVGDSIDVDMTMWTDTPVQDSLEGLDSRCHLCGSGSLSLPPPTYDKQENGAKFAIMCVQCMAMAFGQKLCPHSLFFRDPCENFHVYWVTGWPVFGSGSAGSMASGLVMPCCDSHASWNGYGWGIRFDPSFTPHSSQHHHMHVDAPAASASPVGMGGPTSSFMSVVTSAQVGDSNVQAEHPVPAFRPIFGTSSVATGPQVGWHALRFQQPDISCSASPQVRVARQPASQGSAPMGQPTPPVVNPPYRAYIERFDPSITMWFIVVVGHRVGVFASAPFYARSSSCASGYSFFQCNNYNEAVLRF
ncbi:hypothetical protein V8D89_004237 [Ganoderma adspersum]